MSISAVSNRWLNRLYKILAILLVLFAVLISAFRLFLPYAHNYKQDFQNYLNESNDSNVTIGSLSMGWEGAGPSLIVENVNVLDTESAHVFVKKMELTVNFWRSLQYQKLITKDISLVGAQVFFDKRLLNTNETSNQDSNLIDNVSSIFFQQIKRFSLKNSKITVKSENQTRTFLVDQLSWLNNGNHHRASGSMLIDGLTSNNIKFNLDASGQDIRDLTGQLYFEANKLNITPWLDTIFAIEDDKTDSSVNFSAWYTLNKGEASKLQIALNSNEVSWFYQDELHSLRLDKGNILIENFDDELQRTVTTTPLQFYTNNHAWQPLTVNTKRTENGLLTHISSLELVGIADLYPLFSGHIESEALFDGLAPVGQISDVYLLKTNDEFQALASFSQLTSSFSQGIPGIENVSGELSFADNHLTIELLAENGQLDFNKHFLYPIPYESIASKVDVDFSTSDLSVKIKDIEVISSQIHATADIEITSSENTTPAMALLANVHRGDVNFADYFYPHLLMGQDLVDYLEASIIDGEVEQAQVLFNGPLANFPFHDNSGIFVVDAELIKSKFQFDPSWPVINDFSANLNFTNNSMLITGRGGSLSGIDVTGVEVAIDDLENQQILTVDASFKDTKPIVVGSLMNNSPMASTVGETLNQLQVSNNISGSFALNLPLNDLDNVIASGKVNFNNNQVALQTPAMNFTDVNGELTFKNDVINTRGITLNWRKMPMELVVKANDTDNDYFQTLINLQAKWPEISWKKELPQLLEKYANGQLDWQGDLTLKMHHKGGVSYELMMNSTFDDLAFELPVPYKKSLGEVLNVSVNVSGQNDYSELNAQVGNELYFYGELDHEKTQFSKAHLLLGNEDLLLPSKGFHITTKLATASLTQWQSLVLDILDSIEQASEKSASDSVAIITAPERIRGSVEELDILGQTLTDVSFNLLDKQQWWLLDLNAKEARTKVKFYPDWHQQGVDIDADFIHLTIPEEVVNESEPLTEQVMQVLPEDTLHNDILFANIPPIRAKCASCSYGKLDFGAVDFTIERSEADTIKLKKFTAKRGKTNVSLDGSWVHNQKSSSTKIIGQLETKDLEQEVIKLGYPSSIKDSGIKLTYALNWQSSPFDFELAKLNGDVNASISDGVVDVDDKGARYLSIFSLSSLARKLKLDFRDMFSDGMFYESIKGDFHLEQGIIYTDNTKMKGGAGNLSVKGNTDLSKQILDYSMSYKPNVTSSLPALAWVATLNPVAILAGLALDGVITSKVISELKFEVTGTMQEPVYKQVDRKTQNIRVGRTIPPEIIDESISIEEQDGQIIEDNNAIKDHKKMDNIDG
jgi:uncharacterized protein (TIGR02099 family)